MKILNNKQIHQKVRRLAIEILEHNLEEQEIVLAGINNNGMIFAEILMNQLLDLSDVDITVTRIKLNPAAPTSSEVLLEIPPERIENKVIIIVDDVANTGRTLFYAIKPLLEALPKKIEMAVLVDRKHKSFPVRMKYVGLALATTLKENIEVHIKEKGDFAVYLN